MPDVTLYDIADGVRQTWAAAGSAVTNVVPVGKVYFGRQAEGSDFPYCNVKFKDVSAYFDGTEYFSGRDYVKDTQITFEVYHLSNVDMRAFVTALNNALGWGSASPAASWTIPNATILSAMGETEGVELVEERQNGADVVKYSTTYTVKMQADRGT